MGRLHGSQSILREGMGIQLIWSFRCNLSLRVCHLHSLAVNKIHDCVYWATIVFRLRGPIPNRETTLFLVNTFLGDWTLARNIYTLGNFRNWHYLIKLLLVTLSTGELKHLLGCRGQLTGCKLIQILIGHLAPSCFVDIHRIAQLLRLYVHHICSFLSLLGRP